MTDIVEKATEISSGTTTHAPELIDNLIDRYELEAQDFLHKEAESIRKLVEAARNSACIDEAAINFYLDKLDKVVRNWCWVAKPIQLSAKARGIDHEASRTVAHLIRKLAIDLFNKNDFLEQSRRLTGLLQELFSKVPELFDRIAEDADTLNGIAADRDKFIEKFKEFNLSGTTFSWKKKTYHIGLISHIRFYRAITTHSVNYIETGKTEKALLTLIFNNGQSVNLSIDELSFFWNKNKKQQIQILADFYGYLLHVTFDRRLKFYEDQIERTGYWVYDKCYFYPHRKVVFRGRDFDITSSSFIRNYGLIELRTKNYGIIDKIKSELSMTKFPQFDTLTDTDVIFHLLDKHMGIRWNNQ